MSAAKQIGECKWFNSKKGFGFITPKDGSEDVFVHQSAIHAEGFRSLAEKEPVEFETEKDDNGRIKATKVTGPGGAYVQGAPKPRSRFTRDGADGADAGGDAGAGAGGAPRGRGGYRGRGGRRGGRGKPSGESSTGGAASAASPVAAASS